LIFLEAALSPFYKINRKTNGETGFQDTLIFQLKNNENDHVTLSDETGVFGRQFVMTTQQEAYSEVSIRKVWKNVNSLCTKITGKCIVFSKKSNE